jgi:adenylate kinase
MIRSSSGQILQRSLQQLSNNNYVPQLLLNKAARAFTANKTLFQQQPAQRTPSEPLVPSISLSSDPSDPISSSPHIVSDPWTINNSKGKENFEIKDAEFIFRSVWNSLLEKYGEENMSFPKDVIFLAGAPGAGKGVTTPQIMDYRGITSRPLEVGALLVSPEAQKIKDAGGLVSDRMVIELLLEALLKPEYQSGVLIDGFPRTKEQAECIKLLYDQMQLLRRKYADTLFYHKFRRPIFHIVVLYIDKEESVRRQLRRGKLAQQHNEVVLTTGIGQLKQVRETDIDPKLAEERYRQFRNQVYDSLKLVKEKFHFHFINAEGSPSEVQERILNELKYQSSMELGDDTFEQVRKIPLASEVILHARHELVRRLDDYRSRHSDLFDRVIQVIMQEFVHIIKRQALSGKAIIRSNNKVFEDPTAINMALDLLTERGYTVVLDLKKKYAADKVNLSTGEVIHKQFRLLEFTIEFAKPNIRRG